MQSFKYTIRLQAILSHSHQYTGKMWVSQASHPKSFAPRYQESCDAYGYWPVRLVKVALTREATLSSSLSCDLYILTFWLSGSWFTNCYLIFWHLQCWNQFYTSSGMSSNNQQVVQKERNTSVFLWSLLNESNKTNDSYVSCFCFYLNNHLQSLWWICLLCCFSVLVAPP